VRWDFPDPLVPGRLIRRYKRFLADVELDQGGRVTAHCPNPGSMLGCLADRAPVYLSPQDRPGRRTPYTWEMIHLDGGWVGINTLIPNKLAFTAARLQALPIFQGVREVRAEVKVSDHSRIDLMVRDRLGEMFVEVKNVTLVQGGRARFPDSPTKRGAKHLGELMKIVRDGGRAAMLYVVQHPGARAFEPAGDIDPRYDELFQQARRAGVEMCVVRARVSPRGVRLERELPLA
jgi:sugar fermentation stimulation protein A